MTTLRHCEAYPLNLNYFDSLTSIELDVITLFGILFHSDILNLKCRKIQKQRYLFSLIVANFLSSSILQVKQQEGTGFFPLFYFYSCNGLFTGYMQLVDSLCSRQTLISCISLFLAV